MFRRKRQLSYTTIGRSCWSGRRTITTNVFILYERWPERQAFLQKRTIAVKGKPRSRHTPHTSLQLYHVHSTYRVLIYFNFSFNVLLETIGRQSLLVPNVLEVIKAFNNNGLVLKLKFKIFFRNLSIKNVFNICVKNLYTSIRNKYIR